MYSTLRTKNEVLSLRNREYGARSGRAILLPAFDRKFEKLEEEADEAYFDVVRKQGVAPGWTPDGSPGDNILLWIPYYFCKEIQDGGGVLEEITSKVRHLRPDLEEEEPLEELYEDILTNVCYLTRDDDGVFTLRSRLIMQLLPNLVLREDLSFTCRLDIRLLLSPRDTEIILFFYFFVMRLKDENEPGHPNYISPVSICSCCFPVFEVMKVETLDSKNPKPYRERVSSIEIGIKINRLTYYENGVPERAYDQLTECFVICRLPWTPAMREIYSDGIAWEYV
jgi:hypothetical protein